MQALVWEKRFSVGIRQFDQHHKILFEMINSLIFAQEDKSDPDVIKNTLEQLRSYTLFHFKLLRGPNSPIVGQWQLA